MPVLDRARVQGCGHGVPHPTRVTELGVASEHADVISESPESFGQTEPSIDSFVPEVLLLGIDECRRLGCPIVTAKMATCDCKGHSIEIFQTSGFDLARPARGGNESERLSCSSKGKSEAGDRL